MFLNALFRRRDFGAAAHALYERIVAQARTPGFYRDLGVPDTPEGRFEMVALHAFLVLHRLKDDGGAAAAEGGLGQALFDLMFADMDRNLREMGTGDLAVGRRVRTLAEAFYGRIRAYEAGLDKGDAELAAALKRDLLGGDGRPGAAEALAAYVRTTAERLARVPLEAIAAGDVTFGPVPARPGVPAVGGAA